MTEEIYIRKMIMLQKSLGLLK